MFVLLVPVLAIGAWSLFNEHVSGYRGPTSMQGYSLSNVTCEFTDRASPRYREIADVLVREAALRRRATGDCADAVYYATPALQRVTGLSTQELSKRLTSLSKDLIVNNPGRYARSVSGQWIAQWNYWSFGETPEARRSVTSPVGLAHAGGRALVVTTNVAFLALLATWGVLRLRHQTPTVPLVVVLAAWMVLLTCIENPLLERGALPRQLSPAHPAMILVVVYGIGTLLARRTPTSR